MAIKRRLSELERVNKNISNGAIVEALDTGQCLNVILLHNIILIIIFNYVYLFNIWVIK